MAQTKNYAHFGKDFPAYDFETVTPDDASDLSRIPRSLYVGVGGDIVVHNTDGTSITFVGVGSGVILPIQPQRILATGTSATNIIALY